MLVRVPVRRPPSMGRAVFPSQRFLLGALTPDAAARLIFPNPPRSPHPGHNMATFDAIVAAAGSGQMSPAYLPGTGDCAGVALGLPKASIVKGAGAAGSLLLKMGAASANPILLGVGAAAEIASIVFGAIFGHHAKAVAKERSILCAAVPAANQTLVAVDEAVEQGLFSPQNAIDALRTMVAQFGQQVAAIQHGADPTVAGECNAACLMFSELRAIVARKVSQYQDMLAQPPAGGAAQSIASMFSGAGASFLPWAAAGLVLYLILSRGEA